MLQIEKDDLVKIVSILQYFTDLCQYGFEEGESSLPFQEQRAREMIRKLRLIAERARE